MIQQLIGKLLPTNFKKQLIELFPNYFYTHTCYSQDGEDMLLNAFYEGQKSYKGFFVDVGAHHPTRFSNTMFFYKKGWRGINIDPTPGSMKKFRQQRSRDINLEIAISSEKKPLTFYLFNEPALNGFDGSVATERDGLGAFKIIGTKEITPYLLSEVLDKHLPNGQKIDFFTIDVEGIDYDVLTSNNWEKYRPKYIFVESPLDFNNLRSSKIYTFLQDLGYELVGKTKRTLLFGTTRS